jgi:hypothetical protein
VIQSLLVTCRLHDVNPYTYLVDVLQRIDQHPASRVDELGATGLEGEVRWRPAGIRPAEGQSITVGMTAYPMRNQWVGF